MSSVRVIVSLSVIALCGSSVFGASPSIESNGQQISMRASDGVQVFGSLSVNGVDMENKLSTLQSSMEKMNTDLNKRVDDLNSDLTQKIEDAEHEGEIQDIINSISQVNVTLSARIDNANHSSLIQDAIKSIAKVNTSIIARLDAEKIEEELENQISQNESLEIFGSIEGRLNNLEDVVYEGVDWANLIQNGDFQDDNGNAANATRFIPQDSSLKQFMKIMDISNDPPPGARASNHSLMLGPTNGNKNILEYQITYSSGTDPRHSKICPGSYRFRAWVKVSTDYDGVPMVLHSRFYLNNKPVVAFGISTEAAAISAGAWPRYRDTWTLCEFVVNLPREANMFHLYLGYPFVSTQGSVMITDIEVSRIGGGVSNC